MIKEIAYQAQAVDELVEKCAKLMGLEGARKKLVFKAPTGAGKTVMASRMLERLATELPARGLGEPVFIWIAPNQLHEQSCVSMRRLFSGTMRLSARYYEELDHSGGLNPDEILFVNWQKINSKDNVIMREDERGASLPEMVRRTRAPLVAVIDEEHLFAGGRAATQSNAVLERLCPKVEIRISATPVTAGDELVNVPREEVIAAQMIKEGITINPRLPEDEGWGANITLLRAALKKREELKRAYAKCGAAINPLLLIQMPNDTNEKMSAEETQLREEVQKYLETQAGMSADNGRLGVWLSGEKRNLDGIEKFDSLVDALIFKQAIAMGWDCPRAAVLLIFRDLKSVTFTMQTVGRILRMPEQTFYPTAALNRGHVYTNLARDRIEIVKDDVAYITRAITARRKEDLMNVRLMSEWATRPSQTGHTRLGSDFYSVLRAEVDTCWLQRPYQQEFVFSAFEEEDADAAALQGDLFGDGADPEVIAGNRRAAEAVGVQFEVANVRVEIPRDVDVTPEEGVTLVDESHRTRYARTTTEIDREYSRFCAGVLGADFEKASAVPKLGGDLLQLMEDCFGRDENAAKRIILAKGNRELFRALARRAVEAYLEKIKAARAAARERMFQSYEWEVPLAREYDEATNEVAAAEAHALEPFVRGRAASNPEKEFEAYLEANREWVDWWYKNGESGREHFAVSYRNASGVKALFYVDFVVRMKSGRVWLFDTKTPGSDTEAVSKHNALVDFLKAENDKGRRLGGGVLIKDPGGWRYSRFKISDTENLSGWDMFVPAETEAHA